MSGKIKGFLVWPWKHTPLYHLIERIGAVCGEVAQGVAAGRKEALGQLQSLTEMQSQVAAKGDALLAGQARVSSELVAALKSGQESLLAGQASVAEGLRTFSEMQSQVAAKGDALLAGQARVSSELVAALQLGHGKLEERLNALSESMVKLVDCMQSFCVDMGKCVSNTYDMYIKMPHLLNAAWDMQFQLQLQNRMKDGVLTFPYDDREFKFYLPFAQNDIIQSNMVHQFCFWEIDLLQRVRKFIRSGCVVVDAGANIGNHAVYFASVCRASRVYAFEPQKTVGEIFRRNIQLNGLEDVVELHACALGDRVGSASIGANDLGNVGGMTFVRDQQGTYELRALDSLQLPRIDFLKIDVEGGQLDVLKGATQLLSKSRPVVWIEMLDREHSRVNYDEENELIKPQRFLKKMGYELVEKLSPVDYVYVAKTTGDEEKMK